MSTELIINASLPETRIVLQENGEIQELLIERASGKGIVGNIYKGRVTRVLPGMQAAFVDIGLEKAAFLYVDDVYVHSDIWEAEEEDAIEAAGSSERSSRGEGSQPQTVPAPEIGAPAATGHVVVREKRDATASPGEGRGGEPEGIDVDALHEQAAAEFHGGNESEAGEPGSEGVSGLSASDDDAYDLDDEESAQHPDESEEAHEPSDDEDEEDDEDHEPVEMGPGPGGDDEGEGGASGQGEQPHGTVAPENESRRREAAEGTGSSDSGYEDSGEDLVEDASETEAGAGEEEGRSEESDQPSREGGIGRRRRRGRRGGKGRRGGRGEGELRSSGRTEESGNRVSPMGSSGSEEFGGDVPENLQSELSDTGEVVDSDRAAMVARDSGTSQTAGEGPDAGRPVENHARDAARIGAPHPVGGRRGEFNQQRSRDRRIRPKQSTRPSRGNVNIQDLLKEGQEVIVQVAKDPIATKGARLTCHLSLPGRHLVCMPTIDHVGVSRRIERDDERRKLREYVERYRPKNLGFIVRTASGRNNSEQRIKQDIEYLTRIWNEIKEKANSVAAPALVYEDLNSVLRAIRDWVTDEIDKIVVDSRYHYNEILRFVSHFMPSLKQKVELYHGDIPIFDAYNISTELSRALERKVWLKSGGYLVIDQAEALVAIDVNTGRFVGKKNLEDTILKTNLEAVQEIAYQLRLRNCGGIIILDLIDMEKEENRQRVYRALEEALKKDRARPSILKISELGLVEMTRKRTRDTMVRALCESCSHCEGKGFIKSKQTVAYEILREIEREGIERDVSKVLIQAHPDVIDIMAIDERETLDQLERRYRKQIYLQAVTDFHPEQFEVSGDKQEGARAQPALERSERGREAREDRGGRRDRSRDRDRGRNRDRGRDRDRDRDRDHDRQRVGGGGEGRRPQSPVQPLPSISQPQSSSELADHPPQFKAPQGEEMSQQGAPHDDFEEEDRLAFLRAQAAQDAALAKFRGPAVPGVSDGNRERSGRGGSNGRSGGGGGGAGGRGGGRRGRRGRRGRNGYEGQSRSGSGHGGGSRRDMGDSGSGGGSGGESAPSGGNGKPDHQNPV